MTLQALPRNGKIRFGGFFLYKRYGREIGFEEKCLSLSYQKRVKRIVLFINYKDMVNYKDLGLVNTREMFKKAINGGYAIPAFNFNNMEQMQAIIQAAVETKSPVILQVSKGARQYANATLLRYMAQGAVEYAKELGCANPQIVLHLDHGDTFETCKSCVDLGFSSVMIDGTSLRGEHRSYKEGCRVRSPIRRNRRR